MIQFRLEKLLYLNSKKSFIMIKFIFLILKKKFRIFEKNLLGFFNLKKMKCEVNVLLLLYSEIILNRVIFRKLINTTEFFFLKTPSYRKSPQKIFSYGKSEHRTNRLKINFFYFRTIFSSFLIFKNSKNIKKKFILTKYKFKCNFLNFFSNIWHKIQFFFRFSFFFKIIFFRLGKLKKMVLRQKELEFQKKQNLNFKNPNLQKGYLSFSIQKQIKNLKLLNIEKWLLYTKKNNFGNSKNYRKKSFKTKNWLISNSILIFSPIILFKCDDINTILEIFFEEIYKPYYLHCFNHSSLINLSLIKFKKKNFIFMVRSIFFKKQKSIIRRTIKIFYKSFILFLYIVFFKILKIRILSYYLFF